MKSILLILAMGLIALNLNAQKILEKNIDYNRQSIDLDLKFASQIEIKTWDKPTIYVKADITMEDKMYQDMFVLNVEENGSKIKIGDNSETLFQEIWEEKEKKSDKNKNYFAVGDDYDFNYVIYLPKNVTCKISSINGSLKSENLEGDFETDLINGNIEIGRYSGNLKLSTINGEIDLPMVNTSLKAETIHGNIFADEKLKFKVEDGIVGQKIVGRTENAKNALQLNTINGNMYLR